MYKFKSKADGDLIMMTAVGDQILHLIGKAPAPQGIIERAAIPAAMAALQAAVHAEDEASRSGRAAFAAGTAAADDEGSGAVGIGLGQRAWPMLEMMRRAVAEQADIVWGV